MASFAFMGGFIMLRSQNKLIAAALFGALLAAPSQAQPVTILHSFVSATDGQNPSGALTQVGSTFYGTTNVGGSGSDGTIFQINPDGTNFGVLHAFAGGLTDGDTPFGTLVQSGSTLYGMTQGGGSAANAGTIYRINTNGSAFAVLHAFVGGANDGYDPVGSLTLSGSTLYGMTPQGGTANMGTIFRINTDGSNFGVVHSFVGGAGDGQHPGYSAIVVSNGVLYGMTQEGGAVGQGTVFKINADGTGFTLLHAFNPASGDGWDPNGSLVLSGNTLYGMTYQGGGGPGTIFQINTDGSGYSRLHNFAGGPGDGAHPIGDLFVAGSALYGMTSSGGADGLGVLFGIATDGSGYADFHFFAGGPNDGSGPMNNLILSGSTLYGMTVQGGSSNGGVIFSISVPEPSPLTLVATGATFMFFLKRFRHSLVRTFGRRRPPVVINPFPGMEYPRCLTSISPLG
jgi:uncharacterized repeat protein (TIGR03803 family)